MKKKKRAYTGHFRNPSARDFSFESTLEPNTCVQAVCELHTAPYEMWLRFERSQHIMTASVQTHDQYCYEFRVETIRLFATAYMTGIIYKANQNTTRVEGNIGIARMHYITLIFAIILLIIPMILPTFYSYWESFSLLRLGYTGAFCSVWIFAIIIMISTWRHLSADREALFLAVQYAVLYNKAKDNA